LAILLSTQLCTLSFAIGIVATCYMWEHMKSVVYEMKSQMVAKLTGCIIDATAQIRNESTNY
jgi:hypothetical protein